MIEVTIDENEARKIIADALSEKIGCSVTGDEIHIEVKSKQSYRSEWELAAFRAVYRNRNPFGT
jgi:hypothetical protein